MVARASLLLELGTEPSLGRAWVAPVTSTRKRSHKWWNREVVSLYHEVKKRWALGSGSGTAPIRGWRLTRWDLDRRAPTLKGRAVGVCVRVLGNRGGRGGGRWLWQV